MKKLKVKNHIAKLKHNVRSVEKFISAITHSAKTTEALEDHSEEMVTLWTENKYRFGLIGNIAFNIINLW